jgi:hypothetical protein
MPVLEIACFFGGGTPSGGPGGAFLVWIEGRI